MSTSLELLFGPYIDLGPCLVGYNLNQLTVRGFADIATLAIVSGPDVYDKKLNPNGTQRELKKKHASEAFQYAMESKDVDPAESPRSFPEVLFNIRDAAVAEFYELGDPKKVISTEALRKATQDGGFVGLRIRTQDLEFPQRQFDPQISRVDGNHRLSSVNPEERVEDGTTNVGVSIPYCVFVEMTREQEVMVFADINGKSERMNVDHIQNIKIRTNEDEELMVKDPALWLAKHLAGTGGAFEDTVYFGGSKAGHKLAGHIPQVNLNALKKVANHMLSHTSGILARYDSLADAFDYYNNYWLAVRRTFPVEWSDKKGYILLQSVGLTGFAGLGATLITETGSSGANSIDAFSERLQNVKDGVSLAKSDPIWEFAAGPAGGKLVERVISRLV